MKTISPKRRPKLTISSFPHYFYSVPTTPTKGLSAFVASCESQLSSSETSFVSDSNSFEFKTSLSFNKTMRHYSPEMASADELFHDGRLLPLPPRLQSASPTPSRVNGSVLRWSLSSISFKKEVDPFTTAAEMVKKEDLSWCKKPCHRRTMSLEPMKTTTCHSQEAEPLKSGMIKKVMRIESEGKTTMEEKVRSYVSEIRVVKDEVKSMILARKKEEQDGRQVERQELIKRRSESSIKCSSMFACFGRGRAIPSDLG